MNPWPLSEKVQITFQTIVNKKTQSHFLSEGTTGSLGPWKDDTDNKDDDIDTIEIDDDEDDEDDHIIDENETQILFGSHKIPCVKLRAATLARWQARAALKLQQWEVQRGDGFCSHQNGKNTFFFFFATGFLCEKHMYIYIYIHRYIKVKACIYLQAWYVLSLPC